MFNKKAREITIIFSLFFFLFSFPSLRAADPRDFVLQAQEAVEKYDIEAAQNLLDQFRNATKKGRNAKTNRANAAIAEEMAADIEAVEAAMDRTSTMLERVQKIEVIDSINVPAEEFFRYYRLTPESGSVNAPSEVLPQDFPVAENTVVYEPQSAREMIWAAPDPQTGEYVLMSSSKLTGDEWDAPQLVEGDLNQGGDANYPFLMPDGITLYYANDGEESLGGYDIFITRRGDDGSFLQPQNLGMPFNSPYNDYLLAIDELTGAGWWATDRNRLEDMVTIYIFIPQELRVNVTADDPSLLQRALLSPLSATWQKDADYSDLRRRIASISATSATQTQPQFRFAMPGRVVTSLSQMHNTRARQLLAQWVTDRQHLISDENRLHALRLEYARGDRSNSSQIQQLESSNSRAKADLLSLANQIIQLEQE